LSRAGRWTLAGAGLVLAAALLVPATADWLVTREGDRIETAGPWRVENRLVVFKRPDGTYASMRLTDVDLEASERLTREMAVRARSPEPEPETQPRAPIARLTERELPPVGRQETLASEPAGGAAGAEGPSAEEPRPEAIQIITWRELGGPDRPGIEIVGDVRNLTDQLALGVSVTAVLLDETGEEIASSQALLTAQALSPGAVAGFRASFPGIFHYSGVEFRSTADLILSGDRREPAEEEPPGRR
jgi:hypothetical protein